MDHLKSFKLYEEAELSSFIADNGVKYYRYVDRMSPFDRKKMEKLADIPHNTWSKEDQEFMKKMSKKDVVFWVDKEGNKFTEKEMEEKGIDTTGKNQKSGKLTETTDDEFQKDIDDLISRTKTFIMKYKNNKDLTKVNNALRALSAELDYQISK
jgi:hypothetical protein